MNDENIQTPKSSDAVFVGEQSEKSKKRENRRSTIVSILILAMAPVLAFVLSVFVFQSYQVDGPSMEKTLQNDDRLVVWKFPHTWAKISGQAYIPNRGDVIIFNYDSRGTFADAAGGKRQLIKRVIGLPGERVVVKDGHLTVYNDKHPEGFDPDKTLPYGSENTVVTPTLDDQEVVVGKNQVFVCGDNRPDSLDSRSFGPVDSEQIVGKLIVRILPLSKAELF